VWSLPAGAPHAARGYAGCTAFHGAMQAALGGASPPMEAVFRLHREAQRRADELAGTRTRVHFVLAPYNFLRDEDDAGAELARLDAPLGATVHELAEEICNVFGWRSQGRSFELELFPTGSVGDGGEEVGSGKIGGGWCVGDGDDDDEAFYFGGSSFFGAMGGRNKPGLWAHGPAGWARSRRQTLADLYRVLREKSLLIFIFAGHYIAVRVLRIGKVDGFCAPFIQRTSLTARPNFQPPLSEGEEEDEYEDD
jgi:hypothetical protein